MSKGYQIIIIINITVQKAGKPEPEINTGKTKKIINLRSKIRPQKKNRISLKTEML